MMSVKPGVHFGVWLVLCGIILGWPPEFRAQNRIFARVELNKNRVNSTAEIYNSSSATGFAPTGAMVSARKSHTATVMLNGKVLLTGGHDGSNYLQTAEIFDPATATFSETTKYDDTEKKYVPSYVNVPRAFHTATLLSNGMVLLVGGLNQKYLDSAELYNPATGKFTATSGALNIARAYHTAILLASGQVLITGGYDGIDYLDTAELYDPSTRTFKLIAKDMSTPRAHHSATLMASGEVLIAGGYNQDGYLATAEIYDPANETFRSTSAMAGARAYHAAALLSDSTILIAGGTNGNPLATAEIFNPATSSFTATAGAMTVAREGLTAILLRNSTVLIAGGFSEKQLNTAEIYNPSGRTFTALTRTMTAPRQNHTATLLTDGTVLLAGGQNSETLVFDVNTDSTDNIAPNILFSADGKRGFVACAGSGVVVVFSPQTGELLNTIETGGKPTFMTPLADGRTVAAVSAWENKVFLVDLNKETVTATLAFTGAEFSFGSVVVVSHDGGKGYISSTGTGEVIKFSLPAGQELGRLGSLRTPGQLALMPDDKTLIVVDTTSAELLFVDTATMAKKSTVATTDKDGLSTFSIFNDLVLSADGKKGIVASRGLNENGVYSVFVFDPVKAEILNTLTSNIIPGRTALTPDGKNWVVLCEGEVLVVPVADPASYKEFTGASDPLLSANVVFSPDSRYVYYASAADDHFVQQELASTAIVGKVLVGDDPDVVADQPSSVGITPDGKILAVVDFASNNLELLTSSTVLAGSYFISNQTQLTGVTLVNLSDRKINVKMTAETDFGTPIEGTDIVNPIDFVMEANSQLSMTVDQLFHFDLATEQKGWLLVECDQPGIIGYLAVMKIKAGWLSASIDQMDGVPLFTRGYHDWIAPYVSRETGEVVELDFLSTNYSPSGYKASNRTNDGSEIEARGNTSGAGQIRYSQVFDTVFTQSLVDQILIVGGSDGKTALASAETADAGGSIFTATPYAPHRAYASHTATALYSGKVLILGGKDATDTIQNTAEIYDPASSGFVATTGAMLEYRYRCAAVLLQNGRVLVSGGQTRWATSDTAELYDPVTDTFVPIASHMTSPRDAHTATLLPNGKVLLAGGASGDRVLDTAEIYDPGTGTLTATGNMMVPRSFHTATLLANGKVLIAGGYNGSYLNSAEVYDPATGKFSSTSGTMSRARSYHTATLLPDGRALITGGTDGTNTTDTAEVYDESLNAFWLSISVMHTKRQRHTATLMTNGKVLILGGTDGTSPLPSVEFYDPEVDSFTVSGSMTVARSQHTATLLPGGADGYIRATSTEGFAFSEFYGNADHLTALNGIDVSQFASIPILYSPHFALGFGFRTILNVINANASPAEITIKLHGADGTLLGSPQTRYLTTGGQLKEDLDALFGHDAQLQNTSGWLEIQSTVDFVVGTVTFTNADGDFESCFQLQGSPMTDFVFPLTAQDSTFLTAFALLNAGDQNADIVLELWAPDGSLERTASVSLPPGTRTAQYLSQYFPSLGNRLISNVRVHSSAPIFAFGLMHDKDLHFMSALPPISYPEIK